MDVVNSWAEQFAKLRKGFKSNGEKKAVEEAPPVIDPIVTEPEETVDDAPIEFSFPKDMDTRKREFVPLTVEELQRLVKEQHDCDRMVESWRDKMSKLLFIRDNYRKPKSLHLIMSYLGNIANVSLSTMSLAGYYLENEEDKSSQLIKDCKLYQTAGDLYKLLQRDSQGMTELLDELEVLMKSEEDRSLLNLKTGFLKQQFSTLNDKAVKQAKAFSQVLFEHPSDMSFLTILEHIAEKNDPKVMSSIDNTLYMVGTNMVLVSDAPSMIEALHNKDMHRIADLQKRLIDNRFDKK